MPSHLAHEPQYRDLREVIAGNLVAIRNELAWKQDDLAAAVRAYGLDWSRATVAALETGRRDLSLVETLVLKTVLSRTLEELLKVDEYTRVVSGGVVIDGPGWIQLLRGEPVAQGAIQPVPQVVFTHHGLPLFTLPPLPDLWRQLAKEPRESYRSAESPKAQLRDIWARQEKETARWKRLWEAETKAAKKAGLPPIPWEFMAGKWQEIRQAELRTAAKLGVTPLRVIFTAHALWGYGVTDERDRRLKEAVEQRRPVQPASITRALIRELADSIAEQRGKRRSGGRVQ